jgi:hypothetical protein
MLMAFACLVAIAAGVNFYWTVDDTPLATAMQTNAALRSAFQTVAGASLLGCVAVLAVAVPVVGRVAWQSIVERRWTTLRWLAVPLAAACLLLAWLWAGWSVTGRVWVATPWDVTGDWPAPVTWPALSVRWTMALVTCAMLLGCLLATGWAVSQVVRVSDQSDARPRWWLNAAAVVLATAAIAMTAGVASWGWLAERHATTAFHAHNGGLFSSTNATSWCVSAVLFVLASIIAVRSAAASFAHGMPARD